MAAQIDTTDLYGFPIKITQLQASERKACDAAMEQNVHVWMEYIEKDRLPTSEAKLKDMIRKGVAPTCRTWMWMNTSTAVKRKASVAPNYYQIMVTAGASVPCLPEIEADLPHTFSSHPWISSPDGQAALRRVLTAYAAHNDKVGYCRSMNNIVALLLVAMNRNEDNAFWLLASLVEDILYPGTYSNKLEGCQVEMKALDELVMHKLPRLHAHLLATDCDISLFATDWYLSLFCTSLPSETVARVWDALFNEGPKILFRVALALMKQHEEHLIHCDNAADIVILMRTAAAATHHHGKLMSVAFEGLGSLPMATIGKFRDMKAREVEGATRGEGSTGGASAPASAGGAAPAGSAGATAADKAKAGFGKFMAGMNKWAEKTADKMAQAAEKIGIKDDEPLPGQGGPAQTPKQ